MKNQRFNLVYPRFVLLMSKFSVRPPKYSSLQQYFTKIKVPVNLHNTDWVKEVNKQKSNANQSTIVLKLFRQCYSITNDIKLDDT